MVKVDFDGSGLASKLSKLELLELSLHSFIAPTHVNFLLFCLVLRQHTEDILHDALSMLLFIYFLSL